MVCYLFGWVAGMGPVALLGNGLILNRCGKKIFWSGELKPHLLRSDIREILGVRWRGGVRIYAISRGAGSRARSREVRFIPVCLVL
jgi:hypothetical protein